MMLEHCGSAGHVWKILNVASFEEVEPVDDDPEAPFYSDQSLTIEECVQGYTVNAARACWRDHFTGMLRVGFSADLIVLDRDIFTIPATEISQTRVLSTLFKGVEVWRANDW